MTAPINMLAIDLTWRRAVSGSAHLGGMGRFYITACFRGPAWRRFWRSKNPASLRCKLAPRHTIGAG